ncbi:hypothetical protein V0U79_12500 [Hyphobacterium sp. HN65]|uniref:Uncharacterized protein n=1 Tax=Hyphobacterium lacteum TaxID=3116575 RepID=A0ABU7LV31_9PROT|nr:hypothetical protein [Hyphobacterium sp. HN65]MEE2527189.1 hypothetical protein [Hyphobacterium sp. HN65]
MIVLLVLLQSALPPATSESTNPETRTDRFEFQWEWSSNSGEPEDTRSEIECQNEDRAGRTGGWVETAPGVYEFRAPEPVAEADDDWGFGEMDFSRGGCSRDELADRARLAAALGVDNPGCGRAAYDPEADNPELSDDAVPSDTPR